MGATEDEQAKKKQKIKSEAKFFFEERRQKQQQRQDREFQAYLASLVDNDNGTEVNEEIVAQIVCEMDPPLDVNSLKQKLEESYAKTSESLWRRPTPRPNHFIGVDERKWPVTMGRFQDGLPTPQEIADDNRARCLGISNAYGTGKTQFAIAAVEVTLQRQREREKERLQKEGGIERELHVLYASFANAWAHSRIVQALQETEPKKHFKLWLYAAYHSTKAIENVDGTWEVLCAPQIFQEICVYYLNNPKSLLPEITINPSMMVVFDEVQVLSFNNFQLFVDEVLACNSRISLLVGAFSSEFTVGSANRVLSADFRPLNTSEVEELFKDANVDPVFGKVIHLPKLLDGCIRPFTNFNPNFKRITEGNHPIEILHATYTRIYGGTMVPALLFRAAISNRPCSTRVLRDVFEKSSTSLGAAMILPVDPSNCLVKISPFQVLHGVTISDLEEPDLKTGKYLTLGYHVRTTLAGFAEPTWNKFEALSAVAPALRLAALTHPEEMGWTSDIYPLQEVFGDKADICTESARNMLSKKLKLNLKIKRVDAGHQSGDYPLAQHFDKDHITIVTCHNDHVSFIDNFLLVPCDDDKCLIIGIEAKYGEANLPWKDVKGKVEKMASYSWTKEYQYLLVIATSRHIPDYDNLVMVIKTPLIISNNLTALFGSCLVPAKYRACRG